MGGDAVRGAVARVERLARRDARKPEREKNRVRARLERGALGAEADRHGEHRREIEIGDDAVHKFITVGDVVDYLNEMTK